MDEMAPRLIAVLAGRARAFREGRDGVEASAIFKAPVARAVIGFEGIVGDEQADRVHHGGADKALHHYPSEHYAFWRGRLGALGALAPGGFGENISTTGMTEETVLLGDRFRLGTALVEVSHGRQPCWKLGHRFGWPGLAAEVTATGRCGWYYRVLEPGEVSPGDALERMEAGLADWPVARLFRVLIGGGHKAARGALAYLAGLPVLAEAWRARARELG